MTGGGVIRGSRIGAGPRGERQRSEEAPRQRVDYWCDNGHHVQPSFSVDAEVPELWDCPHCGLPAGRDENNPPAPRRHAPYKSHLAYVKERRSDSDGRALLEEALTRLQERRGR